MWFLSKVRTCDQAVTSLDTKECGLLCGEREFLKSSWQWTSEFSRMSAAAYLSFDKLVHLRTLGLCKLKLFPPLPASGPCNSKCKPVINMSEVAKEMQFVTRIFYLQFVFLWTDTQSHRHNFGGGGLIPFKHFFYLRTFLWLLSWKGAYRVRGERSVCISRTGSNQSSLSF